MFAAIENENTALLAAFATIIAFCSLIVNVYNSFAGRYKNKLDLTFKMHERWSSEEMAATRASVLELVANYDERYIKPIRTPSITELTALEAAKARSDIYDRFLHEAKLPERVGKVLPEHFSEMRELLEHGTLKNKYTSFEGSDAPDELEIWYAGIFRLFINAEALVDKRAIVTVHRMLEMSPKLAIVRQYCSANSTSFKRKSLLIAGVMVHSG